MTDRQRAWKEKQAKSGKKSVTIMISKAAKDLIDKEKSKTGQTIAEIIEKALQGTYGNTQAQDILIGIAEDLKEAAELIETIAPHAVTSKKSIVASNGMEIQLPPREVDPNRDEIYRIIGEAEYKHVLFFQETATHLNYKKYKTLSGKDEWDEEQVEAVVRDIKANKQIYLVPQLYKFFFGDNQQE